MLAYKVVMVGDFGTGKTSLIRRFVDDSFSEEYLSTIGVSISKKQLTMMLEEKEISSTLLLWDIEGKTEYKPIFKQYLTGSKGFIIVADITRKNTIEAIPDHIALCQEVVPDAPIYVALNKCDLQITSPIPIDEIMDYSKALLDVYLTSAKDGSSVLDIFAQLNNAIVMKNQKN